MNFKDVINLNQGRQDLEKWQKDKVQKNLTKEKQTTNQTSSLAHTEYLCLARTASAQGTS